MDNGDSSSKGLFLQHSALQWTTSEPSINFWAIRAIKSETAVHSAVEDAYKEKFLEMSYAWCLICGRDGE